MSIRTGPFRRVAAGSGAKIGPYYPLSLPNMELYLDSRRISGVSDGADLLSWADLSGHSPQRDAVSYKATFGFFEPKYWSTTAAQLSPTGKPTVQWGTRTASPGNLLGSSAAFTWPLESSRGYTFYWYGKAISKTAPPYPFISQLAFTGHNFLGDLRPGILVSSEAPSPSFGAIDDRGGGNPHKFGALATISGDWVLHTLIMPSVHNDTVPMRYYLNGAQQAQTAGPTNWLTTYAASQAYAVGGGFTGNTALSGNIGAFLWFTDIHSQPIIDLMVLWASIFWGLT